MADTFLGYSNKRGRINPFLNQYYATSGNVPSPDILRNIVQGELEAAYNNRIRQQELAMRREQLDAQKDYWRKQSESAESANRMQMLSNIGGLATTALGTWDKWKDSPVGKGVSYVGDVLGKGYDWLTGNQPTKTYDTTYDVPFKPNVSFMPQEQPSMIGYSGLPTQIEGNPSLMNATPYSAPEEQAQTRKVALDPTGRKVTPIRGMGEIEPNWGTQYAPKTQSQVTPTATKQTVPLFQGGSTGNPSGAGASFASPRRTLDELQKEEMIRVMNQRVNPWVEDLSRYVKGGGIGDLLYNLGEGKRSARSDAEQYLIKNPNTSLEQLRRLFPKANL